MTTLDASDASLAMKRALVVFGTAQLSALTSKMLFSRQIRLFFPRTQVEKADYEKERQAPKGMEWRTWEGQKLPQKEDDN